MNGVRRFLASTVQGSTQTSSAIPTVSDQPPLIEKGTTWASPGPGSSSRVSNSIPSSYNDRRDSSSSTISARESLSNSIVPPNQPARPLPNLQLKSVVKSPPESPIVSVPNMSLSPPEADGPSEVRRGSLLQSKSRGSAATGRRSGPSLKDKGVPLTQPLAIKPSNGVWRNGTLPINTKDELLMMLLTSQAVLDSREFEILSAEEVEELKRVRICIKPLRLPLIGL